MNKRARNEFIWLVVGILMIVVGTAVFLANAQVKCGFFGGNTYTWWQRLLFLLPLLTGVVLIIIKPEKLVPKIVASIGVFVIAAVIIISTTVIIKDRVPAITWIACILLWVVGGLISVASLLLNGRKRK